MIHRFQPTFYHNAIGSYEPALRIGDGDTVITTTIDALGGDSEDKKVWDRGNPMTGPFHIEGAQPGDALAVRLDKITPNRRAGYTAESVAANVVDPDYVRELPRLPRAHMVKWDVDVKAKTASIHEKDYALTVPLLPMIGCFGVAPSRGQAISTATSGPYGGNMDYNGWIAGVTAYFPVSAEGALFHLGDVHAVQGDGEIVGTGIEISAEVKFTVKVLKKKPMEWPRGENRDFIWTVGNARPLDQCIQHATTEMMRWLQADYGMNARHASTLLGQCVKYDMGNVFDPAYTMVCRLAKQWLS